MGKKTTDFNRWMNCPFYGIINNNEKANSKEDLQI